MDSAIIIEIIKILPSLVQLGILLFLIIAFYGPIKNDLLPNLSNFKAFGLEASFITDSLKQASKSLDEKPSKEDTSSVARRAKRIAPLLKMAKILWVDDNPRNNMTEVNLLESLGISVNQAERSQQALDMLSQKDYDLVISDMNRSGVPDEGIQFLHEMRGRSLYTRTIFYLMNYNEEKGTPPYAFGITNRPDHLLHLIFDIIEREYT